MSDVELVTTHFHLAADPLPPLKPMATAPRERRVLALDECMDGGELIRVWRIVYWCDAWDGVPGSWRGRNSGDVRTPLGWLMTMPDCGAPGAGVEYDNDNDNDNDNHDHDGDATSFPRHGWTCFHCTEHFPGTLAGKLAAAEHFGPTENWSPLCLERKTLTDDVLLKMSRAARLESQRFLAERHEAEDDASAAHARMSSLHRFPGRPRTLDDAFNLFHSMEGRALAAEAIIAAAKLHAPDAMEKARIEACGPDPTGICY